MNNEPKYGPYPKQWCGPDPIDFITHLEGYDVWIYRRHYDDFDDALTVHKYVLRNSHTSRILVDRRFRTDNYPNQPPPHIIDYLRTYDKLIS